MNSDEIINNEKINAYVDDQLSTEVKAEILKKSQENEAIAESICQTQVLKGMVKLAYQTPPDHHDKQNKQSQKSNVWRYSMVASILLMVGVISGWFGALQYGHQEGNLSLLQQVQLTSTAVKNHQVLLHISTNETSRVEAALNNAERLLSSNNNEEKFQLQILVNAEGINILQKDKSPYIERLRALAVNSDNVALLACKRSIERQKLKGIDVHLVTEAQVIPEALEAIVSRLHQGWVYIRA